MNFTDAVRILKLAALIAGFVLALRWAPSLGYCLTGDLHSGGPLFGYPVLLIFFLVLGRILFREEFRRRARRSGR